MTQRPPLRLEDLDPDPVRQFEAWFAEARERSGLRLPEAAHLATVGPDGYPQGRVVLLKGVDPRGFAFYTNLDSEKGKALAAHPRAALTFYWEATGRQVRVRGDVTHVGADEADAYFASRPRGSRIGAWASDQSRPLESREALEARVAEVEARFEGGEVPRPHRWGGFRIAPRVVEFWQEGAFRLHDRFRYARAGDGWTVTRLYP